MDKYIGLLKADGSEPTPENGYHRVAATDISIFPDSINDGYGIICSAAYFDAPEGGAVIGTANLPVPVDCHAGVTPIFKDGNLLRGVAVRAEVLCNSGDACSVKEVST